MPKMGLKMREIGFQRTYIFKIFRGSMPPVPPRKVRLRRTITFSNTYEHPLENLSYAPAIIACNVSVRPPVHSLGVGGKKTLSRVGKGVPDM